MANLKAYNCIIIAKLLTVYSKDRVVPKINYLHFITMSKTVLVCVVLKSKQLWIKLSVLADDLYR